MLWRYTDAFEKLRGWERRNVLRAGALQLQREEIQIRMNDHLRRRDCVPRDFEGLLGPPLFCFLALYLTKAKLTGWILVR
jgi:hypothetical protein